MRVIDILFVMVLVVVSALCIGFYLLPQGVQESLKARSGDWSLLKFYTSTFIHFDLRHLAVNFASFLGIAVFLYRLSFLIYREKRFLESVILSFLAVPLISNALFFLFTDFFGLRVASSGLSGIVASMIGMIVPMMCVFLGRWLSGRRSIQSIYTSLTLLTGATILYPYIRALDLALMVFALALATGLLFLLKPLKEILSYARLSIKAAGAVALASVMLLGYFLTLVTLFPSNIVSPAGYTVNILAHSIGVFYGIITGAYMLKMLHK